MTLPSIAPDADSQPCLHPAYLRMLCATLRAECADVDSVLARAGITWAELERCEHMLPLRIVRGIILAAQSIVTRPTLALEVGAQMQLASHGAIGYCLSASANLRQALDVLVRFTPYRARALRPTMHVAPDGAWVVFETRVGLGDVRPFVLDWSAGSAIGTGWRCRARRRGCPRPCPRRIRIRGPRTRASPVARMARLFSTAALCV